MLKKRIAVLFSPVLLIFCSYNLYAQEVTSNEQGVPMSIFDDNGVPEGSCNRILQDCKVTTMESCLSSTPKRKLMFSGTMKLDNGDTLPIFEIHRVKAMDNGFICQNQYSGKKCIPIKRLQAGAMGTIINRCSEDLLKDYGYQKDLVDSTDEVSLHTHGKYIKQHNRKMKLRCRLNPQHPDCLS